jgi:DNA replication protein DnaC
MNEPKKTRWETFVESNAIPKLYANILPDKSKSKLYEVGKQWQENPHSMVFYGSPGTGKTHFSLCLVRCLLRNHPLYSVLFVNAKQLGDELLNCFKQYGSSSYVIEKYKLVDYLFIDDFGMERATEKMESDMFDIINFRAHEPKVTVISTNFSPKQILENYGSRIFSRLKPAKWILFDGEDLRAIKHRDRDTLNDIQTNI